MVLIDLSTDTVQGKFSEFDDRNYKNWYKKIKENGKKKKQPCLRTEKELWDYVRWSDICTSEILEQGGEGIKQQQQQQQEQNLKKWWLIIFQN